MEPLSKINTRHSSNVFNCLFSLICLVLIVTGCEKTENFKIGFVGDLTGSMSDLGINGRNGVLMAVEERNAEGGINGRIVELITKDDKHLVEQALKVDQELINEGVVAIIGHMTSTMSVKALPLINEEKVLMVSPTTSKLSGIADYFIRMVPYGKSNHDLAEYTYKTLGLRNIAIVYDLSNAAFSELIKEDFTTEMESSGGKVILSKSFSSSPDLDYVKMVKNILESEPEGLLIVAGPLDTAMICQHIRISGSPIPILLNGWAGTKELVQHGGPAVEGVFYANMFNQNSQDKTYVDFKNRFMKRFGNDPNFAAVYSFEASQLLFNALSENGDPKLLKDTILKQGRLEGLQGEITFDKFGDAHRKVSIVTIQDKNMVVLE